MKKHTLICLAVLLGTVSVSARIRNGNFQSAGGNPPNAAAIEQFRKNGIKCPDAKQWSPYWHCIGKNGTVEFIREKNNRRFARISGKDMLFCGTDYGKPGDTPYIAYSIDVRGKGALYLTFLVYPKKGANKADAKIDSVAFEFDSSDWTSYLFVMKRTDAVGAFHPALMALKGTIDIDNVDLIYGVDNDDIFAIAEGEAESRLRKLHKTDGGAEIVPDKEVKKRIEIYRAQDTALREFVKKNPGHALAAKLLKHSNELRPYLLTEGLQTIRRNKLNRAMALSFAIWKVTGSKVVLEKSAAAAPSPQKKKIIPAAEAGKTALFQVSGIKPGRILYYENDDAMVSFSVENNSGKSKKVCLKGILHSGINDTKNVYDRELILRTGRNFFRFNFNVGPESFGRAIEVIVQDENGTILAKGREFFQANKEFMRVMLHGTSRYQNVFHLFGHEQSDFGVQDTDDQIYFSNERRLMNKKKLIRSVRNWREKDFVHVSFYQCRSFSGQVGLEEVRKYPEYILYGENGQPEIDPFYGGVPDPFEIASPGELEPTRRTKILDGRTFLDVKLSACHTFIADFSNLDCVAYGAKCVREYQKKRGGLDIVYLDDTPSVMPGYTFEGKYNIAGLSKKDLAALNASIARTWNTELRRDNPNAGSWCNGANPNGIRWYRSLGMWERTMGMGVDVESGVDVSDEYIRELTSVYNSMFLSEIQHSFNDKSDIKERNPVYWMNHMLEQRDYIVQKYKGNIIFGYICIDVDPDIATLPRNLYWTTLSYFHALTLATQHHHTILCLPPGIQAMQPYDQFMTRYSGLLWDKELIALPKDQAKKTVQVRSKAKLLYEDFVYTRKYDDSDAVIIHFVRPYPLEKWDLNWTVPPTTLRDVQVTVAIPEGKKPVLVKAMRPYDVHEKDEVVEQLVKFEVKDGKVVCTLPAFAYYNMLVVKYQ